MMAARSVSHRPFVPVLSLSLQGAILMMRIFSLANFTGCILLLLSLAGCSYEVADPSTFESASASSAPQPGSPPSAAALSEEEIIAWAEQFERDVHAGDSEVFDKYIDMRAILETATAAPPENRTTRDEFIQGVLQATRSKGLGLGTAINEAAPGEDGYSFLHVQPIKGQQHALFRLVDPKGSVNYHGYILAKQADRVRAVDVYIFSMGETMSQGLRRTYLTMAVGATPEGRAGLSSSESLYAQHLAEVNQLMRHARSGRYVDAMRIYHGLPELLQRDKGILMFRLGAAKHGGQQAYIEAVDAFRQSYPDDPALRLLLMDVYALRKDYAAALREIDQLDEIVGGDPYLHLVRGGIPLLQGDEAAAQAHLRRAIEEDPQLLSAYKILLGIAVNQEDHDETLRLLRVMTEEHGQQFPDLAAVPKYAKFARTPQYQQWLEFRNGQ